MHIVLLLQSLTLSLVLSFRYTRNYLLSFTKEILSATYLHWLEVLDRVCQLEILPWY
ncbi:hypothetical protein M758_3G029600 [Ceratodon purpureus]|uniref:Uncharacterized protein n=1 Tax=Ceratodon purpureus TaxID=3225 RepID=A0A8T0IGV9_CERPU|nr:hypothetical protein KC19_3G030700 [Ceratodon purpureus]KAG0621556.1 hypothetical protein M758_3G029600 [Ceratodon purpureus]